VDWAEQWLHQALLGGSPEHGLDALEALEAAGALSAEAAARWRRRFAGAADEPVPVVVREHAERLLTAWLEAVPRGHDAVRRFQGASELLAAVGAVDGVVWDARLRERAGWPSAEEELALEAERNAGGTEADLLAVFPGPPQTAGGHRLLLVLCFADGVTFRLDGCAPGDWPEWTLTDDLGAEYVQDGGSSDGHSETISFGQAVPPTATWIELARDDIRFRVPLV
jgi:hypothetical protein